MYIENYLIGFYHHDLKPLKNKNFSQEENFGRLISVINIPGQLLRTAIDCAFNGVKSSIGIIYNMASIPIALGQFSLKEIKNSHAQEPAVKLSFCERFKPIKVKIQNSLIKSVTHAGEFLLTILERITYIAAGLIGIALPEVGRKARIIELKSAQIKQTYKLIHQPEFEEIAKKAYEMFGLDPTKIASPEEIKQASKQFILNFHPDQLHSKISETENLLTRDCKIKSKQIANTILIYQTKNKILAIFSFLINVHLPYLLEQPIHRIPLPFTKANVDVFDINPIYELFKQNQITTLSKVTEPKQKKITDID